MGINAQTSVPKFTIGDVLTSANTNLLTNAPPVFSGTATRDAAFGGGGEKTLAEGQLCYLEDTNIVQYYDGSSFVSLPKGYVLNTSATATTSVSSMTQTTVLTATVTIMPNRLYSAYGFVEAQSASNIGAKGLWFEETNSAKILVMYWDGQTQSAFLPFSMAGTVTFSSADVGVTSGSGTSRTFNLRVWFNGATTALNTNPDGVLGANTSPQMFTILDVGNS